MKITYKTLFDKEFKQLGIVFNYLSNGVLNFVAPLDKNLRNMIYHNIKIGKSSVADTEFFVI